MTTEVAILNKYAVALAADSAVTLAGIGPSKVYNTVNKLFALSSHEPVGIMVYGSDALMSIPWETIVKMYRKQLDGGRFAHLVDYANDFMCFIENKAQLFPEVRQAERFRAMIRPVLLAVADEAKRSVEEAFQQEDVPIRKVRSLIGEVIERHYTSWLGRSDLAFASPDLAEQLVTRYSGEIERVCEEAFGKLPKPPGSKRHLQRIAAYRFTKDIPDEDDNSGLVIAGFGYEEVFPALVSYGLVGPLVCDRLRRRSGRGAAVTIENSSEIIPFAQVGEIEAFLGGIHPYYKVVLDRALKEWLAGIWKRSSMTEADAQKTAEAARKSVDELIASVDTEMKATYSGLMLSAVAVLPKDELATMAEQLVRLTSFKQRVTVGSETVGGPIDVAVISKGDGFVWIKVKHYYDAEINPPRRPL